MEDRIEVSEATTDEYYLVIRPEIRKALDLYVAIGKPTGGFLRAVLENDLTGAVGRADSENLKAIRQIVHYVYNELPGGCWGDRKKVDAWLDIKAAERKAEDGK